MRLSARFFRYIVLVSVVLNLGDAPYLDEIFDDLQQDKQGVSASYSDAADPALPVPQDSSKHTCHGFQRLLLSLQAVVAEAPSLPILTIASEVARQEVLFPDSVSLDRIDRPPHGHSTVV
jgi:hypothetical protein